MSVSVRMVMPISQKIAAEKDTDPITSAPMSASNKPNYASLKLTELDDANTDQGPYNESSLEMSLIGLTGATWGIYNYGGAALSLFASRGNIDSKYHFGYRQPSRVPPAACMSYSKK